MGSETPRAEPQTEAAAISAKAATNARRWYVTISRGRRGIRIFTPDKEQLRENVTRSGRRPLASELAGNHARRRAVRLERLHSYLLRFGRRAANNFCRLKLSLAVVINPLKFTSTKIPECWASDPNARAVKIELSAEQSLLLPFDQFAFSELKSEGKEQQLRLVFATHEVLVRGHSE